MQYLLSGNDRTKYILEWSLWNSFHAYYNNMYAHEYCYEGMSSLCILCGCSCWGGWFIVLFGWWEEILCLGCTNRFIDVRYNQADSTITCVSLNPTNISIKSCRVTYGLCSQEQTQTVEGVSSQWHYTDDSSWFLLLHHQAVTVSLLQWRGWYKVSHIK